VRTHLLPVHPRGDRTARRVITWIRTDLFPAHWCLKRDPLQLVIGIMLSATRCLSIRTHSASTIKRALNASIYSHRVPLTLAASHRFTSRLSVKPLQARNMSTRDVSSQSNIAVMKVEADGSFKRKPSQFRNSITPDGEFKPEAGRYHLYVSYACRKRYLIFSTRHSVLTQWRDIE
jgi:hypothetical protein